MAAASTAASSEGQSDLHIWLYTSDRSCQHLYSGIPQWRESTTPITEPVYSAEDQALIAELKASVAAALAAHGLTTSDELKSPLKDTHWRDIYNKHKNKTNVVVTTPDPRLSPAYQPSPAHYQSWPDYRWHQFLVGRKRKVPKATTMVVDYLYWWQTFGMDDLIVQPVAPFSDAVEQFYAERVHGIDADGRPIVLGTPGQISVPAYLARALPLEAAYVVQSYKQEVFMRLLIDASHLTGKRVTQFISIQDLAHFTMHHRVGVPWVKNQTFIASNFYPETLYFSIVPNMPGWFTMLWSILKQFLDERTQQKVDFPGSNWQQIIREKVGGNDLPAEWGGQCARCQPLGGCLPLLVKYDAEAIRAAQAKQVEAIESRRGTAPPESITVHARGFHEVNYTIDNSVAHIKDDGSELTTLVVWWSFELPAKDIDFEVQFHSSEVSMVIVPSERVSSHSGRVRGCHTFTVSTKSDCGTVKLLFSNHFSMFSGKTLIVDSGLQKVPHA